LSEEIKMTFLKFQEKPKSSGVYYVYEYRSFREKTDKDKSNYGKVRHALVAYHGRADKALKKLLVRAPEFSQETWKKMVHYARESRKPGSTESTNLILSQIFTVAELKFLMLFAPKDKMQYSKEESTLSISLMDLAKVINAIEEMPVQEVISIIEKIEQEDDFKTIELDKKKFCVFYDTEYFSALIKE
jgi:hypothetical protein